MTSILIVGGGSIGKRHARNILNLGVENVAIVEPNAERGVEITKELGVPTFVSIASAYADSRWEVAFICSPTAYHLENAIEIANFSSHLFIEKPLAHTTAGLKQLLQICEKKNLVTMVGSNWKFHPLFIKMKALLESGVIGNVLSVRAEFGQYLPDWHPYEDYRFGYSANKKLGGGILFDSHEIDYLTWFMDAPVAEVTCVATKASALEIDVEDVAEVIFKFKNGSLGAVHVDYLQRFYKRTFEFFGSLGTISWDVVAKKVLVQIIDQEAGEFLLSENYDFNEMYFKEVEHFLEAIKNDSKTVTPLARGVEVVELIVASKKSNEEKRTISIL